LWSGCVTSATPVPPNINAPPAPSHSKQSLEPSCYCPALLSRLTETIRTTLLKAVLWPASKATRRSHARQLRTQARWDTHERGNPTTTPQQTTFSPSEIPFSPLNQGQSEQVRKLLSDARMREVCREIVEQGERRLKQALKDQDFAAKINEILQVIGVRDEEGRFIL
jgi:hypothetical protein